MVSFLILKDQKSVLNYSKVKLKRYSYKTGEKIRVATKQGIKSTREVIALNVAGALDIYDDVEVGRQVLVDDGKLGLRVVEKDDATREFVVEVETTVLSLNKKV